MAEARALARDYGQMGQCNALLFASTYLRTVAEAAAQDPRHFDVIVAVPVDPDVNTGPIIAAWPDADDTPFTPDMVVDMKESRPRNFAGSPIKLAPVQDPKTKHVSSRAGVIVTAPMFNMAISLREANMEPAGIAAQIATFASDLLDMTPRLLEVTNTRVHVMWYSAVSNCLVPV
jgi:hypothetical protein